jgi:hypothetical protein
MVTVLLVVWLDDAGDDDDDPLAAPRRSKCRIGSAINDRILALSLSLSRKWSNNGPCKTNGEYNGGSFAFFRFTAVRRATIPINDPFRSENLGS